MIFGFLKNRRGFTMLEVVMATVIMAVGIIPVYHLMTSGTRGVEIGEREILAVGHTSSIIEFFKGLPYDLVRQFCLDGKSLKGEQRGFLYYDRNQKMMVIDKSIDGTWKLEESSPFGTKFFEDILNPEMPSKKIVHLPPLEKFYKERNIDIQCEFEGAKYCIVGSTIKWQTSDQRDREFSLRTVITGR